MNIDKTIIKKAEKIKLIIADVDGVLTDGKIYFIPNANGGFEELKSFYTKDGVGIRLVLKNNIKFALITGRSSSIILKRGKELGIKDEDIFQNSSNKILDYKKLQDKYNLTDEEICYIGDDLPDLEVIKKAGLGVTVADSTDLIKQYADLITNKNGGYGAVRELCDIILFAQNLIV